MTVVYDIETIASIFTYVDIDVKTEKISKFVIHKDKNESQELFNYLQNIEGQVGFNNLAFDYPIIHYFLSCYSNWKSLKTEDIISLLYNKAQEIIAEQDENDYKKRSYIKENEYKIKQLDLFKIWHYNNVARSTSLKALQISMNYPNVMEMPIHHSKEDVKLEDIEQILEYNLNDVLSTYEFYKKSKDKIDLRKSLTKEYKIPCINYSDSKIGESLILKLYCEKTNNNPWDIKQLRTYHKSIKLEECIVSYIKFQSKEFNGILDKFKSSTITETKGSIEESVIYKGLKYIYGTGGIHACCKSGIYESDNYYIIKSFDVASLYPNLSIQNNFFIRHLGHSFVEVYKDIIDKRIEAKKAGNMAISDALKLSANSTYGKSNDINSFLYDPKFTMCITLSGQLSLTMLCERLLEIEDSTMLMLNTDGGEIKIPRQYEQQFYQICEDWEKLTKLTLEYVNYNKMIIGDVNNYSSITDNSKIKNKGRFEIDKVVGSEKAYHKDNSFRIIPYAINNYFFNNIPVEDTIKESRNIYDFSGRQKFKGQDKGETHKLGFDLSGNPIDIIEVQQKNVRYYISNKGSRFIKKYKKGTSEIIHKGFEVTIFNKYIDKDWKDYQINYQYYIQECYKEINNIKNNNQLTLF